MWTKIFAISLAFTQTYAASVNPICATTVTDDFNPFDCCELPTDNLEHVEDISVECILAFKKTELELENMTESELNCFGECLLNKTGLLKDKVFQLDAAVDFMSKTYNAIDKQSPLRPLVREAFEICDLRIRHMHDSNLNPEEGTCSDYSVYLFGCVDTHIVKNCPADLWNTAASCNKFKENSKHCLIFEHFLWTGVANRNI